MISHMLVADDSYLYYRASSEEACRVLEMLVSFEKDIGQKVNLEKSLVFFSKNTTQENKDIILHRIRMQAADATTFIWDFHVQ